MKKKKDWTATETKMTHFDYFCSASFKNNFAKKKKITIGEDVKHLKMCLNLNNHLFPTSDY